MGERIWWSVLGLAALAFLATAVPARSQDAPASSSMPSTPYAGKDLFKMYCAACHGESAHGDGPLAANMKRKPPDLTLFAERNGGVFSSTLLSRIIDGRAKEQGHGGPDMPVWGEAFRASGNGMTDEQVKERIDALTDYLKELQRKSH